MKNNKLAIAIPTYNRAEILKENLLCMMDSIKEYSIPLYISDDSTNDATYIMINELKKNYKYIYYTRNIPSLGHDENCFHTLNMPQEEYIWYLGDAIIIPNDSIQKILRLIERNKYNFIVTNHLGRKLNLPSKLYINAQDVFDDLAWHITLTGSTIYKKDTLAHFKKKSVYKNFPQTSITLNRVCNKCSVYYDNSILSYSNKNKISYWNSNVISVFCKDWIDLISSIPCIYTDQDKKRIIKSHSYHTKLFGVKNLLLYKSSGIIGYKDINLLKKASHLNTYVIHFIFLVPNTFINLLKKFFRK